MDPDPGTDRMSVRSATLSLYKSEDSLERPANGKSLPASPFIRKQSHLDLSVVNLLSIYLSIISAYLTLLLLPMFNPE